MKWMVFYILKSKFLPFHDAEQRSKERTSDSAEYPALRGTTFRRRPLLASSAGQSDTVGPSDRLHFLGVRFLYASKENEPKYRPWYL
jgi:hypothetical protein